MRTLFLRIFLSFWAAMVLVVLSTAGLAAYRFSQVQTVDSKGLVRDAAARALNGGLASLQAWVKEAAEENPRLRDRVFILDPMGKEILGRELPTPLQLYADRIKRAGFLGKVSRRGSEPDPLLLTPQFEDDKGNVYTFMMLPFSTSPVSLLQAPDVPVVVLAFTLVISGVVCWWLAGYVCKPVERLQTSARSLAAGKLEARVGEEFSRRHDELGVLARDFDTMADHVRNLLASKESLLRGMSHELRSPLARLRVALGLARREGEDLPRQLDRIEREAERLDKLIGQMLQLSQLRAVEPVVLRRSPMDLTSLLNEVVEDARIEATAADKQVHWSPNGVVRIEGDHALMRSAIENVLRNAVRFTQRGTAVNVTSVQDSDRVHIVIDDHGPGVPPDEAARIFEPFYRVAESRDRDSGGTGLGLAITARVVTLYNGAVKAENRSDGGLSVRITLPAIVAVA